MNWIRNTISALVLATLLSAPEASGQDLLAGVSVPAAVHVAPGHAVQLIAALTNPGTETLYLHGASLASGQEFQGTVSIVEFLQTAPDSLLPSESWEGVVGVVSVPAAAALVAAHPLDIVLTGGFHRHDEQLLAHLRYAVDDSVAVLAAPGAGPVASKLSLAMSPNPGRGRTEILWSMPVAGHVDLRILDLGGRTVRVLESGAGSAGEHRSRWDGLRSSGTPATAGVYFVRLLTPSGVRREKLVRVR